MRATKIFLTVFALAGMLSVSSSNAGNPPVIKPGAVPLKNKFIRPLFKPNLVARNLGWSGEFCNRSKCFSEFKKLGFNKATCRFSVRVVNLGRGAAGRFRVKLTYRTWNGQTRTTSVVVATGLKPAGRYGSKLVYFNVSYYKLNQLMKVTVDSMNQVKESNESDNVSYYRTSY